MLQGEIIRQTIKKMPVLVGDEQGVVVAPVNFGQVTNQLAYISFDAANLAGGEKGGVQANVHFWQKLQQSLPTLLFVPVDGLF